MPDRAELLSALNLWAAEYYPDRHSPPPDILKGFRLVEADLFVLFANTTSARHHLALVDLPQVRQHLERLPRGSPLRQVITTSWRRHLAAARAGSEAPGASDGPQAQLDL